MKSESELIIIGGGLSGLALAYFLQKKGIDAIILEASDRLGGRIQTITGSVDTPLELGATWFSDIHQNLLSLIDELELKKYSQFSKGISLFQTKSFEPTQKFFVPETDTPSYRIVGGTSKLISALKEKLPIGSIKLNSEVSSVRETGNMLTIETTGSDVYVGNVVISCLPPQLASHIKFSPELPESVSAILPTVQTWMAGAIKFTLEYKEAFWRTMGYSGMLYSHAGIIVEMYDHTNFEEDKFGLTGFLNGGAAPYTQEVRKEFVLQQLRDLMGNEIPEPVHYFDKVWNGEFVLKGSPMILRPHQNNGHPFLRETYLNDRFHFCGTEIAPEFPGYMEGAVIAAKLVAERF